MFRKITRTLIAIAAVAASWQFTLNTVEAGNHHSRRHCVQCQQQTYGQPNLFYNYYQPAGCGLGGSQLYPAPLTSTPAHVGSVYYTYQAFMPHEFLYANHSRTYHRYYNGGRGMTRTAVKWYNPPGTRVLDATLHLLRPAR